MTIPAFIAALKGYAKSQGAKDDSENEISKEEFLAVLAEEIEAGRA